MKGVAGNLGVVKLQQLAGDLEQACSNDDKDAIRELQQQVDHNLSAVLANVSEALAQISDEDPSEALSESKFNEKLAEVKRLIEDNDTAAGDVIEALRAGSEASRATQLKQVAQAVVNYDFEEAERLIDKLDL